MAHKPMGSSKTNMCILAAILQEAIRLRRKRPERSVEKIIFILEANVESESFQIAPSTLARHLKKVGSSRKELL
jgi:putative transposase